MESVAKEFSAWATEQGVDGLARMFRVLVDSSPLPSPSAITNSERNRSKEVVCLEKSRVELPKEKPEDTDYIHANWVKFPGHERIYIATQDPLESTTEDFWRMIWQQQARLIVNLSSCCEPAKTAYWPQGGKGSCETFGRFSITVKEMAFSLGNTVTYLLKVVSNGWEFNCLLVHLVNPLGWKEDTPPRSVYLLQIFQSIYSVDRIINPLVVHCSTGVGRTGVFILADYLLFRLFTGQAANVEEAFKQMSRQRASPINEESQFVSAMLLVMAYIGHRVPELKGEWKRMEKEFRKLYGAQKM